LGYRTFESAFRGLSAVRPARGGAFFGPVAEARSARQIKALVASRQKVTLANHAQISVGRGFVKHCREPNAYKRPYSFAALAIAGECDGTPVRSAGALILLGDGRAVPRPPAVLFESTKSATRGTISARKREPLKTP
jgi:hypothetical protein